MTAAMRQIMQRLPIKSILECFIFFTCGVFLYDGLRKPLFARTHLSLMLPARGYIFP